MRTVPTLLLMLGLICTLPAAAQQYLTVERAQKVLFPEGSDFIATPVRLDAEQKRRVEAYSDVRYRAKEQPVWRIESNDALLGWLVVDEVYGKHEFITYAVGLDADGSVRGVEILDYRETHGGEVRDPRWREQFIGKRYGDALTLDETIDNISGATLSCKHVTEGVRRILALYETALQP